MYFPSVLARIPCWVAFSRLVLAANHLIPAPVTFQPSLQWDGNDGAWSSFTFQIGTPPQTVRLLPSTTGNSIWTVWDNALSCGGISTTDCPSARGNLFSFGHSTSWKNESLYSLPLNPEHYLPYSGNAYFGFDNVTLGSDKNGRSFLGHQVVGSYVVNESLFFVGSFGLSPRSINITTPDDGFPSLLGSLAQQNLTPSTSWGYLAGASYYSYPCSAFASLTFGGYDSTRLDNRTNLTLAGGSDPYRTMLVGIESITSESHSFLSQPIIASIDSLVNQIWLPISACRAFESAFGLVWNDTYSMYILDDAQHATLLAHNASITFTLSTGQSHSMSRLNITLPFAAFDLTAKPPLVGNETVRYFPLKQAANDSQYTLGRTFLQEVYLLADYDRGRITLYPGVYPDSTVQANIVTLCPPGSTTCGSSSSGSSQKLSAGAVAGIVIGILALLLFLALAILFLLRHRRRQAATAQHADGIDSPTIPAAVAGYGTSEKPELADTQRKRPPGELEAPIGSQSELYKPGAELESGQATPSGPPSGYSSRHSTRKSPIRDFGTTELAGHGRLEMPGEVYTPELAGPESGSPIYEMPSSERWAPVSLRTSTPGSGEYLSPASPASRRWDIVSPTSPNLSPPEPRSANMI